MFALGLFAFLAPIYLTVDTKDEPKLQEDFRQRSFWSGLALAPIALVVFLTSKHRAPEMYHVMTRWWAAVLVVFVFGRLRTRSTGLTAKLEALRCSKYKRK